MNTNIACSFPGCTNPVIGQCVGYKGSCGRYYCAAHTTEKLCADCTAQLAQDKHAQRVYEDYLSTAEQLRLSRSNASMRWFLLLVVLATGLWVLFLSAWAYAPLLATAIIILGWTAASIRTHVRLYDQVTEVNKTKPRFAEFFDAYQKERHKRSLKKGLAAVGTASKVGAVVLAVVLGSALVTLADED